MGRCVRPVRLEDALGRVLAYDATIVSRGFKGAVPRGTRLGEEHLELLRRAGHSVVYVYDEGGGCQAGGVDEEEAVLGLAEALAGPGLRAEPRGEGKAVLVAEADGLLRFDPARLRELNMGGVFAVAARREGSVVRRGEVAVVVDLVPFRVDEGVLRRYREGFRGLFRVAAFRRLRVAVVVTGSEVYEGLVEDEAGPVVEEKVRLYGGVPVYRRVVRDDPDEIAAAVREAAGVADVVVVTGGMSVDPTDVTPEGLARAGVRVVAYGLPVKPTTMTLYGLLGGKPVIAVSSGIIYFRGYNALDILLPRVMAGEPVTREWLASLGDGGLSSSFLERLGGWHGGGGAGGGAAGAGGVALVRDKAE